MWGVVKQEREAAKRGSLWCKTDSKYGVQRYREEERDNFEVSVDSLKMTSNENWALDLAAQNLLMNLTKNSFSRNKGERSCIDLKRNSSANYR